MKIQRNSDSNYWNGTGSTWQTDEVWFDAATGLSGWNNVAWSASSLPSWSDVVYSLDARAYDDVGNVDPTPAQESFTYDVTAPVVTITAPVDGAYYKSVDLPAGAFTVVEINPYTVTEEGYSAVEGVHTYTVEVTDDAGNVGSDSVTYTVDDTAPVVTISAPSDGGVYTSSTVPAADTIQEVPQRCL